MKYPIVIALPLLMLADYYLTLLGAVLKDKKYSKFVIVEEYELNPIFQKAIKQRKLINIKHLLLTISLSVLMIYLMEFSNASHETISFMLGMLLVMYGVIIGVHIANILFFWYVIKKEGQISGQIHYTYEATLLLSMFRNLLVLLPLIIIYSCEKSPFVLGGLCGVIVLEIIHFRFLIMMKKKKANIKKAEPLKTTAESIK
jgi:hypothetical protein